MTKEQLKDETEDQKMTRMLLESKVLSGGIENRFISTFSADTKEMLTPLFTMIDNKEMLEHMQGVKESEEDKIL
jgi:hypothetical protein